MKVWTYLAIAAGMAAIVLTFGAARDAQRRCDSMRLAAVDRKLQLIMDHLGIAEPAQYLPKGDRTWRRAGSQTVKAYRDATGADLAGAKEAVERTARDRDL